MESIPDTIVVQREGVIVWCNRALLTALQCKTLDDSARQAHRRPHHRRRPRDGGVAPRRDGEGRGARHVPRPRDGRLAPHARGEQAAGRDVRGGAGAHEHRARRDRARRAPPADRAQRPHDAARVPRGGRGARDQQPARLRARRSRRLGPGARARGHRVDWLGARHRSRGRGARARDHARSPPLLARRRGTRRGRRRLARPARDHRSGRGQRAHERPPPDSISVRSPRSWATRRASARCS